MGLCGPYPSALSPQRLGWWARGALGQLDLEAAHSCPLKFGVGLWDGPAGPVGWPSEVQASGLAGGKPQVAFLSGLSLPRASMVRTVSSPACAGRGTCDPVSGHCTCPEAGPAWPVRRGGVGLEEEPERSRDPRPLPWSPPSDGCLVLSRALGVTCGVITPRRLSFPRTQHPRLWVQEA